MAKSEPQSDSKELVGQGLVVISCPQSSDSNVIIKKILLQFNKTSDVSEDYTPNTLSFGSTESVDCFGLDIDNKYYSTKIHLFDIKDKRLISKRFADCVNGVIIYFHFNQDSSFNDIQSWIPFIDEYNNEIKLLVCETIDHNFPQRRHTLQKWCIDNEFELIEICPQIDEELDDNSIDEFTEIDGMVRIAQAIQAHNWPFSTLKESTQYKPSLKFKHLIDKEVFNSINGNPIEDTEALNDCKQFDEKDNEFENFEDLFLRFNEMKVKASQMSETDRKSYAERVTLAFWKAIDGDPQEIDDITEDI